MKRPCLLATVGVAAILAATPARASSSALVVGLVAVGIVGTVVAVAASQRRSSPEPSRVMSYAPMPAAASPSQTPERRQVLAYSDRRGWIRGAREDVSTIDAPLAPRPGTSARLVRACRDAIARTAAPYNVASLEAVSAGRQARVNGRIVVPVEVRAIYQIPGGHEVKRTTVRCEVDRAGRVIATS